MEVSYVNKYTVSKEGYSPFFISPARHATMQSASRSPDPKSAGAKIRKWNGAIRIIGLLLAVAIIVMAVMIRMWVLAIIGGILVLMYAVRIYTAREAAKAVRRSAVPPPSPEFSQTGKWTRYIRFGDHIEKEDPDQHQIYEYSQIDRISDDPAYITLWMDDETQVRVAKKGFTVGTLDGFKQFIMTTTGRLIGPGYGEDTSEEKA